jgi:hypothetical protein
MMKTIRSLSLLTILMLILAGCGTNLGSDVISIDGTTVARTIQYLETGGIRPGPVYNMVVDVPEDWVGNFNTRGYGNRIAFEYVASPTNSIPIFYVEALSDVQFWKQSGSYAGDYYNVANKIDTYFVYFLPLDNSVNGISDEEYNALLSQVPAIMETFAVEPAS